MLTPNPHFPSSPDLDSLTIDAPLGLWRHYRKSLSPHYTVIWRDIFSYYLLLIVGIVIPWIANPTLTAIERVAMVVPLALWTAYWLHALGAFMHEAAHFHIHPDKQTNDRLADWLVCSFVGQSVSRYRKTHWLHHLHLGEDGDPERTYRQTLSPAFIMSTLTGEHVVRVLLRWRSAAKTQITPDTATAFSWKPWARFAAIHLSIIAVCTLNGRWEIALSWLIAVFVLNPAFTAIQNILEHRDAATGLATNRMFGTGLFARNFGSAGFNRHLLHHWDPQISYTRFDDMETYLMQTHAASVLDQARTSYAAAWRLLRQ